MFHMNVYPHHPPYHIPLPERKKIDFCDAEDIEGPEAPEGLLRVLFRFHSDRVFFRFASDRVFFRFLSDRVLLRVLSGTILFESSVIDSSSGSSVIYSSLGSSVLSFRHVAIYYQNVLLLFFVKSRCSDLDYIFKKNFALNN